MFSFFLVWSRKNGFDSFTWHKYVCVKICQDIENPILFYTGFCYKRQHNDFKAVVDKMDYIDLCACAFVCLGNVTPFKKLKSFPCFKYTVEALQLISLNKQLMNLKCLLAACVVNLLKTSTNCILISSSRRVLHTETSIFLSHVILTWVCCHNADLHQICALFSPTASNTIGGCLMWLSQWYQI